MFGGPLPRLHVSRLCDRSPRDREVGQPSHPSEPGPSGCSHRGALVQAMLVSQGKLGHWPPYKQWSADRIPERTVSEHAVYVHPRAFLGVSQVLAGGVGGRGQIGTTCILMGKQGQLQKEESQARCACRCLPLAVCRGWLIPLSAR